MATTEESMSKMTLDEIVSQVEKATRYSIVLNRLSATTGIQDCERNFKEEASKKTGKVEKTDIRWRCKIGFRNEWHYGVSAKEAIGKAIISSGCLKSAEVV